MDSDKLRKIMGPDGRIDLHAILIRDIINNAIDYTICYLYRSLENYQPLEGMTFTDVDLGMMRNKETGKTIMCIEIAMASHTGSDRSHPLVVLFSEDFKEAKLLVEEEITIPLLDKGPIMQLLFQQCLKAKEEIHSLPLKALLEKYVQDFCKEIHYGTESQLIGEFADGFELTKIEMNAPDSIDLTLPKIDKLQPFIESYGGNMKNIHILQSK